MEDVIIIGAGPCGLSAAAELQKRNIDPLIIEKGSIVNSIYNYPTFMHFFSTPELLEIGDVPFLTSQEKASRQEALQYYRTVAARKKLRVQTYEKVTSVTAHQDSFTIQTVDPHDVVTEYTSKYVILATGYFDQPNWLGIPGERLPKVSHYYKEAHPYQGLKVAIIGGKNSAVEAAMDLERVGAEVTMIYRGESLTDSVKPWVRPVFDSLVAKGRINMLWKAHVVYIQGRSISVMVNGEQEQQLENDFVFALTGYRPNRKMLTSIGVEIDEETYIPSYNPDTMETNVAGLYIAGVMAAGYDANVIFIENGRLHGKPIAEDLALKLGK